MDDIIDKVKEARAKAELCLKVMQDKFNKRITLAAKKFFPDHREHEIVELVEEGKSTKVRCSCGEMLWVSRTMILGDLNA